MDDIDKGFFGIIVILTVFVIVCSVSSIVCARKKETFKKESFQNITPDMSIRDIVKEQVAVTFPKMPLEMREQFIEGYIEKRKLGKYKDYTKKDIERFRSKL